VEAPNPIPVSPPSQILRQFPADGNFDPESLFPVSQQIEMLVEFPDGHPRLLVSTSLLVDGEIVETNTSEPFDQFTWDLKTYTSESRHDLQVKVVDSLGLEKTSISIPVSIMVEEVPSTMEILYMRYKQWIILAVGATAGILLIWRLSRLAKILKEKRKERIRTAGPLPLEKFQKSVWGRRKDVPASLEPFQGQKSGSGPGLESIPLSAREIRIGSDPTQVNFVLEDASVGNLHALLRRDGDTFLIKDMDTDSGTWVNYEQLDEGLHRINHGDIIHFGRLVYRFLLNNPEDQQEPLIKRLDPDS
ncbi:FHA domain-containing protein, partial [Chloroflexota bacterium]